MCVCNGNHICVAYDFHSITPGTVMEIIYKHTYIASHFIVQAMEASRLAKNGGPATLSVPWAKSLLKRIDFRKRRRGTTKSGTTPEDLDSIKKTFLSEVVETVDMNDIPGESIFNWEQTGVNLVPGALWTMDKRGKKRIDIAGFKDKRQITAVTIIDSNVFTTCIGKNHARQNARSYIQLLLR